MIRQFYLPGTRLPCLPGAFFSIIAWEAIALIVITVLIKLARIGHIAILMGEALPQFLILLGQFFNTCC